MLTKKCELIVARLNNEELNYCKTNLVCIDKNSRATFGQLGYTKPRRNKGFKFLHAYYSAAQGGVYFAHIKMERKGVLVKNVRKCFSDSKYTHAKERAIYAAYLFEKQFYGDNFPKAEYNRKLGVIKTLSAKDIEFVNSKVAGKLEKVYTVLKELTSEKSAKSDEPLSTYKIEKSTDELLKQIKQTPLKEDALETAATVDEPTEKYPDIFGNPEVQKAIAEMKQKPSLFQRIKNWFAN